MMPDMTLDQARPACVGWIRRLTESLLEQLSRHQLFMDVDIIPEVWISRKTARRQHWEGELVAEHSSK